jgi:hypothetical protein
MKRLVITGIAALAVIFLAPDSATADDTHCIGVLPPATYDSVIVPPGQTCLLTGALVQGNVKALENSRLVIVESIIQGNLEGDKADLVQIDESIVRQNILIKEGGPASAAGLPIGAFVV